MNSKKYWLQYFADGAPAGDGGGDGAAAGVDSPADAGQGESTSTLERLGVPKDKVKRYEASRQRRGMRTEAAQPPETSPAAAEAEAEDSDAGAGAQTKPKWDDILKDPEYKAAFDSQVSGILTKRLAKANEREQSMAKLTPALETLAKKYGVDARDFDSLTAKIVDDDNMYRERAAEMGVDVKTAKLLAQNENMVEHEKAEKQNFIQQQMVMNHIAKLNEQGNALRTEFPDFNLEAEMQNDMFVKLTQPGMLSVEDAYKAVHRKEIEAAKKQAMEQQAMIAAQAAVRAGQARPRENGAGAAATITRVPPAQRSKAERDALKSRIYAAGVSGKKLPKDW